MTSRPPTRAALLALALTLAIAVAGCGSSHGSSSSTTPRVGGGFTAQLGHACRRVVAGLDAVPHTVAAEAPVERRYIQTVRALKPTPALRGVFTRYITLLERNFAAFERHDVAAGKRLRTEIAPLLARLRRAGASGC